MQLLITGASTDRPIQSIKAVRSVTGLGLREAKEVVDRVNGGDPTVITVMDPRSAFDTLHEYGVQFTPMAVRHVVLGALRAMPRYLTIGDVLGVADALGL